MDNKDNKKTVGVFKAERDVLSCIEKHYDKVILIFITLLGVAIRYAGRYFLTEDLAVEAGWLDETRAGGGFAALGHQIGNYTIAFQTLMAFVSYLPLNSKLCIKLLSIIFDFLTGGAVFFFVRKQTGNKLLSAAAYALIIMNPIVFMNSAVWGQCDCMYGFFCLLTILFLTEERMIPAFIAYGMAFAFKQQAIFLLPFILYLYLKKKEISLIHFGISVITYFVSALPAVFAGRGFYDALTLFKGQIEQFHALYMNYPSIWVLISSDPYTFDYSITKMTVIFTFAILVIMIGVLVAKKVEMDRVNILYLALIMNYTCLIFLAGMHDRYNFISVLIACVLVMYERRTVIPFLIMMLTEVCVYGRYLCGRYITGVDDGVDLTLLTFMNLAAYAGFIYCFIKCNRKKNNEK
ncbi:MAG: hypothetical protein K6C99_10020 [Lachnospiraceae bacterium]|nr:hypothetical protein [Lachnospiraceae bacterium]